MEGGCQMKISFAKKHFIGIASVVTMLLIWKIMAIYFDSSIIVPHPEDTLITVIKLMSNAGFLKIASATIIRGLVGFIISAILGIAIGILAGINTEFNSFISPILVTIRSIPVIALILLALIWFNSGTVPIFIAMLTMFPFICTNVVEGIRSVDQDLIEMARFYRISKQKIIFEVYIPAIIPFIISGTSSAMGIGWRAIIIGEVLSQPRYGIGTSMQSAQIFLNVEAVIAWTLIAILISSVFEKIIRWCEVKMVTWK